MIAYIIRRLLLAIPTVVGVCIISFVLFYMLTPPDALARRNLSSKNPSPAAIQAWKVQHGYDKPLSQQFKTFMGQLATFDFGNSDVDNEPVMDKIKRGAGPSLSLQVPAFILGLIVTVSGALLLAYYRGTYLDFWGTFLCVLLMSISYTLYVIVGQYVLGKELKLAPIMGFTWGLGIWKFLLIPLIVSLISGLGAGVRFYRTVTLEEMNQDYVRTARAKGVSEQSVLFRHVLKNAMIPILTGVVMTIPALFLGSLLMESFFGIPGLGSILNDAIQTSDFAVLRAMVYIGSLLYILGTILTDISYTLVDPRVRLGA